MIKSDKQKLYDSIDWTVFNKTPKFMCTCGNCGSSYKSYVKWKYEIKGCISKDPCPDCGNQFITKACSEPEIYTIKDKQDG